jgi:hypothetical protein
LVFVNRSLPQGGGEFFRHWVGVRGFISDRIDPYSAYVPDEVQKLIYKTKAGMGDQPYILDTPFHLILLYLPFAPLSDPTTARAIYTLVVEWALFALAIFSLRLTEWKLPIWIMVIFLLFATLNYYSFQALLEASPVILLGLFYGGILLSLRYEQDELAGALIAVSLYYWEVGLPFIAFILWICYKQSRMRVYAGFGMLSIVLLAVSFLLYPNWLVAYLRAGLNNLRFDYGFSLLSALTGIFPSFGKYLAWGIILIFIISLGYEWNAALQGDDRRSYWVACLCIAVAPLLGFRTEFENLAVLLLPLALVFAIVHDRWNRFGSLLVILLVVILFATPWLLYFFGDMVFETISKEILFLFYPVLTVVGLYWIRWWAIRPPRIWADSLTRTR